MKIFLTTLFFSILLFQNKLEGQIRQYQDKDVRIEYNMENGRLEGKFTSYYLNGKKKAEGVFKHNTRIGIWSVWNSDGTLINQRNYTNLFSFKRIIPKPSTDPAAIHLNKPLYKLELNEQGFIDYSHLEHRAVLWSKRIWRRMEKENNTEFFKENRLFTVFQKGIQEKTLRAYSAKDNEFTEKLNLTDADLQLFDESYSIIAFEIKEESFFDLDKMTFETRVIGIAPVGIHKMKKDTTTLYWIYFPELRPVIAKEAIEINKEKPYIKNLDQVFFFRDFIATITKGSNRMDQKINEYASGAEIEKEAERIEMELYKTEHNFWLRLAK